jgi:alcohol dehydrogenase, propanol-preferring
MTADLREALDFAAKATVSTAPLEDTNDVFDRIHKKRIERRLVLYITS